jgi:hypothetical protein
LRKAQQEAVEFHRLRKLCREVVEVSEEICALRPVGEALAPQERKRRSDIHAEIGKRGAVLARRTLRPFSD